MTQAVPAILIREIERLLEPLSFLSLPSQNRIVYDFTIDSTTTVSLNERAEELREFVTDCGIELPELPTEAVAETFATAVSGLRTTIATAKSQFDDPNFDMADVEQLIEAIEAVRTFVAAVQDLRDELPDAIASLPSPDEVAKLVTEHLIAVYLSRYYPAVWQVLCFIGVGNDAALIAGTTRQFDFARIAEVIGDPLDAVQETVGFGEQDFDAAQLVAAVAFLLGAMGLRAQIMEAANANLPANVEANPDDLLLIWTIFQSINPAAAAKLTLQGDIQNRSLKALLSINGEGQTSVDLGNNTDLIFSAATDAVDMMQMTITPDGITTGAAAPPVDLGVELQGDGYDETYKFGPLSMHAANYRAGVKVKLDPGNFDLRTEAKLDTLDFTLSAADADGFIASLLPPEGITTGFKPMAGWSTKDGFYLSMGATGFTARYPTDLGFGDALRIEAITISVLPADPAPGGGFGVRIRATLDASMSIGPVSGAITGIGVETGFDLVLSEGPSFAGVKFVPPTGMGVSVDAGPVSGGGFIECLPDIGRYQGVLSLQVEAIGITAFGILDTQMPDGEDGWSLILFMSGQFPPIALGFGFNLLGVGGLVGINRDVDTDALFDVVRAGRAGDLLSPENPAEDGPQLLQDASAIFPVTRGQYVLGPTVKLSWGAPTIITADIALAVTLPEPLRIILIGSIGMNLPKPEEPIASINIDVAGVLDLTAQRFDMEGSIHDSVIAGMSLSGGFAIRSCWGTRAEFAASIGGFHPDFEPPEGFPSIDRLTLVVANSSNFKLIATGYFALTSNSLQFGAGLDLNAKLKGFTVLADLGFDVLIIFSPLYLQADVHASATIKRGRDTLCSVWLSGQLSGPGPWRAKGNAGIKVLFWDVEVHFDKSFGDTQQSTLPPENVWADHLLERLRMPQSWGAGKTETTHFVLTNCTDRVMPDAPVSLSQDCVPLGLKLDHFGGAAVTGDDIFDVLRIKDEDNAVHNPATRNIARFAPGNFKTLTDNEKLSSPSFEEMESGAVFTTTVDFPMADSVVVDDSEDLIIIDAPEPSGADFAPARRIRPVGTASLARNIGPAPKAKPKRKITISDETYVMTDSTLTISTTKPAPRAILGKGAVRTTEVSA
ncbi:hypothetical protein HCZ30_15405 [Marivivens donghaensis]|uniref:DUF6603 domain-containing protein n=1 Tax=Marivivens donghaensis TaxID=1699413 RepID=A0ABX0W2Y5_9RHOB|nr:DUF6603 domain-containing protein [Marivivens donghaensis]NIY73816.1 hypothetical protein [Marivivens donghaensis]